MKTKLERLLRLARQQAFERDTLDIIEHLKLRLEKYDTRIPNQHNYLN